MRRLLHAEWTKLRTVPGWVLALALSVVGIVGLGVAPGMSGTCDATCKLPVGPGGEEVTDVFTFVHQPLTGDGSITVRLASLTGVIPAFDEDKTKPGLVPWAKAGLIIRDGTKPGAAYAAVMLTGGHGVRMQYDYTHDTAGPAGVTAPRWLRLTRAGDRITGATSTDGTAWSTVTTVRLDGLPSTVEGGLFVTSPQYNEIASAGLGLNGASGGPSLATAAFDRLTREGAWTGADWTGEKIGGTDNMPGPFRGKVERTADGFIVSGSGDLGPAVAGAAGLGTTITQTLVGTFVGLIFVVVVGTMFITAEYRRGLIRTTVAASPRRGLVLTAKALVLGAVTFVLGLLAATVVVIVGRKVLQHNGVYIHAVSTATEARVIVGTAALLAVSAVLALALGTLVKRGAAAVTVAIVIIVLPYLLAVSVLPTEAARWLLRFTPAAAFALQQSTLQYPQVDNLYMPVEGYFPLSPLGGLAVLAAWTGVALALAGYRLRTKDV